MKQDIVRAVHIGVDVSKAKLDICVPAASGGSRPVAEEVGNDIKGFGTLTDAKLNRLVGIAPEERQSGTREWQRHIGGGRKDVRNALYMACVAALMWNDILRAYYRRKRAEGHSHKWAIVPTMRKMLSLLNRIARDPDFKPKPEPESTKKNAHVGRTKKSA